MLPAWTFGAAVHALTASGAVCGLIALEHAAARDWPACFLWLGIALAIDGVDGPLARRLNVAGALPRFSGVRLDLVVDYLTYCAVPAFVVSWAPLVPPALALAAGAAILLTSLFHFADRQSKTEDGFFLGFPALWNVVVFYLLAFGVGPVWTFALIVALAVATFVPLKWLHPLRVRSLRPLTIAMLAAGAAAALATVVNGFPAPPALQAVLAVTALYAVAIGIAQSLGSWAGRGREG